MQHEAIRRRSLRVLMLSNALGYAGHVAVLAIIPLLASEMVGSDYLAGVPSAAATLGTAVAATPLALRSRRKGRRRGLWLGYLIGAIGAGLAVLAGQATMFWLLVPAMAIFGIANTSNLQTRFAAADLAEETHRARAIAMIVWVGTIGAVVGPPMALWANDVGTGFGMAGWVSPIFLGAIGFTLAGLAVAAFLRPDPLEVAGGIDPGSPFENPLRGTRSAWQNVWPNPKARLALVAMAVSQMAMVAVMTMTPLHMRDHGHAELSTIVIAIHVLGMFGLAPVIGRWADRFGRVRMVRTGALILALGTVSAITGGYVPALVFVGLFLLGLGWSFALISGSALLTESLPKAHRIGAQGLADVSVSVLGAAAAFSSGFVKVVVGYHWLANFATAAAVLIVVAAVRMERVEAEPATI